MRLSSHIMKNLASPSLSSRPFTRKSNSSDLQDERSSSFFEAVNFLLTTYATDEVIARAVQCLEGYQQAPGMAPTESAEKLYTRALRRGMVYEEMSVKSLFVEGLQEAICDNARLCWSRNPSKPLFKLAECADTMTKIAGSRSTASTSTSWPSQELSSNRNWNKKDNRSYNISSESESLVQIVADFSKNNPTSPTPGSDLAKYSRVSLREDHTQINVQWSRNVRS